LASAHLSLLFDFSKLGTDLCQLRSQRIAHASLRYATRAAKATAGNRCHGPPMKSNGFALVLRQLLPQQPVLVFKHV
jgi:hypothetical protein